MSENIGERIAVLCNKRFSCLPKQGKPTSEQWTVLAGIVLECGDSLELVSLASGTKCLSGEDRLKSDAGTLLNDSHAEVLARRGLLYWLLNQAGLAKHHQSSYLQTTQEGKLELKSGIRLHLYTSHPPCGDASISPLSKNRCEEENLDENIGESLSLETTDCERGEPERKRMKLMDSNRTGAKCVEGGASDPGGEGVEFHCTGAIRTKPGRGMRTLSLSCSDKILKWTVIGLQGSLLASVLKEPLFLSSITVGSEYFSLEASQRAFIGRYPEISTPPQLYSTTVEFKHCKMTGRVPSSDSSLLVTGQAGFREVYVAGHKQGWSKKKLRNPSSWSSVCQRGLAKLWTRVWNLLNQGSGSEKDNSPVKIISASKNQTRSHSNLSTLPNSTSTLLNSPSTLPNSSSILPNSSLTLPNSSSNLPYSSSTLPNSSNLPNSSYLPNASSTIPNSSLTLPNSPSNLPNSSSTLPNSSSNLPNSTSTLPNSTSNLPNLSSNLPSQLTLSFSQSKSQLHSDSSTATATVSYRELKLLNKEYNERKANFKTNLPSWPAKDQSLYSFKV